MNQPRTGMKQVRNLAASFLVSCGIVRYGGAEATGRSAEEFGLGSL
jgi:hypothetical protein